MNRKEIIGQLEDLLYNFKNFESVETTDDDVVALDFAINELKGTAQEVTDQEQYKFVPEDANGTIYMNELSIKCPY
ncbi:hypothetical protein LI034_03275 [Clostridium perfringens]|uniref:hypothetical protein n=1 Tax=Clostridium perfringens TaxID=1502 RepID=UPI0022474A1B|nr:hypothetical protein [Clostridium perfringens]EHK2388345.1 hypothetical protein [Clostridium perfringens]MCX0360024.1 hypothetical protein [Clostridium perfringens]MDM0718709.1 hypothetical protein [Clostridium perfringens]MDU2654604.1 hypothetical protein [Clostridium perfringens]